MIDRFVVLVGRAMSCFAIGFLLLFFQIPDSSNQSTVKDFSSTVAVHSEDANAYFRGLDMNSRYEWRRKGAIRSQQQLELSDEFGISIFHGGLWLIRNDRFAARFNYQYNNRKVTLAGSCALEGPLFSKRELLFSPTGNVQRLPSRGGFLDPSQLLFSGGFRWNIRQGVMVDIGAPAFALKRSSSGGYYNHQLEREWLRGSRRQVRYSMGVQTVWTARLLICKAMTLDSRSLLILNGYRLKYQQWSQELKWTWALHRHLELCFLVKLHEDRTVAPKVLKSYSLRFGYKLGQRFN